MPTIGQGAFWNEDPRRWARCRQAAGAAMVAQGWSPHARKFLDVQNRRAMKLWRQA
jgi:hypothetical protein